MSVESEAYSSNWHMFETNAFPEALYYIHIAWNRKIVYFESPKVGSTTMKYTLLQYEWGTRRAMSFAEIHDRRYSSLLNFLQIPSLQDLLNDSSFLKISLVRNPFSRLLATYLDQIVQKTADRMVNLLPFLGRNRHDIWTDISFSDFVDAVCRQPVALMDPHWRVQHDQIYFPHVKYDKLGKLEDFAGFCRHLDSARPGIADFLTTLPEHHSHAAEKLKDFYTTRLIDKVLEKFQIDFDMFGYAKTI